MSIPYGSVFATTADYLAEVRGLLDDFESGAIDLNNLRSSLRVIAECLIGDTDE